MKFLIVAETLAKAQELATRKGIPYEMWDYLPISHNNGLAYDRVWIDEMLPSQQQGAKPMKFCKDCHWYQYHSDNFCIPDYHHQCHNPNLLESVLGKPRPCVVVRRDGCDGANEFQERDQ